MRRSRKSLSPDLERGHAGYPHIHPQLYTHRPHLYTRSAHLAHIEISMSVGVEKIQP